MKYLAMTWIGMLAFLFIKAIDHYVPLQRFRKFERNYIEFFFFFIFGSIFMAAVTDDPITLWGYTPPQEVQFVAIIIFGFLLLWRYYLSPLKQDVHRIDKEVASIKTHVIQLEKRIDRVEQGLDRLEGKIDWIVGRLTKRSY